MRLVIPAAAAVASTNVADSAQPEWSAATTYAAGAIVKYAAGQPVPHHEFESVQAGNLNRPPVIGGTDWWLDLGAVNRHKMFDDRINSRTVATAGDGTLQVALVPTARATALALFGLRNAAAVTVTQTVGGVPQSTATLDLLVSDADQIGLWAYFFATDRERRSCLYELPGAWSAPTVAVSIVPTDPARPVECGHCFLGVVHEIGATAWGAQPGLLDYSTFERDVFGNTVLIPRQNVRENAFTVWIDSADFDRIFYLFETVLGSLLLIDANNGGSDFDALRVFGKITAFRPGLRYGMTPIDFHVEGIA